ncbi:TnsA endonuclease N-terminal domain-containing protein [Peribacillus sp. SCS-155]|uniref:TnsA endonuclease N-terminal domain-containing protein n=1 Tax=Peribacillus sedimenti TaxID=3115297 RepID=UPI003905F1B9
MTELNWIEKDMEYGPKRGVNNKLSWKIHHNIGGFYSNKMEKEVEYESLGECLFYYFLELDPQTVRYYVQPVEVAIPYYTKDRDKGFWTHVPDVLVFRAEEPPSLFQIKESKESTDQHSLVNRVCTRYAAEKGWRYEVVYPKMLPKEVIYNINYLHGFTRPRRAFKYWGEEVMERIKFFEESSIDEICTSFAPKADPLMIKPIIYHLIAKGILHVDLYKKISSATKLISKPGVLQLDQMFNAEEIVE